MAAPTDPYEDAARSLADRLRRLPAEGAICDVIVGYVIVRWLRKELNDEGITPQADNIRNDKSVDIYPTLHHQQPVDADTGVALSYLKDPRVAAAMDFAFRALHPVVETESAQTRGVLSDYVGVVGREIEAADHGGRSDEEHGLLRRESDAFDRYLAILAIDVAERAARGDRSNEDPELWFAVRVLEFFYEVDVASPSLSRVELTRRQRAITTAVVIARLLLAEIDPTKLDERVRRKIKRAKEKTADKLAQGNGSDARSQVLSQFEKLGRRDRSLPTMQQLVDRFSDMYSGRHPMDRLLIERLVGAYHETIMDQRRKRSRASPSE